MTSFTCLLLMLSATCSAPPQESQSPATDPRILHVDPLLIAQAQEAWKYIARDDNDLWPGWNASSTPILFYLRGVQDLLINPIGCTMSYQEYSFQSLFLFIFNNV